MKKQPGTVPWGKSLNTFELRIFLFLLPLASGFTFLYAHDLTFGGITSGYYSALFFAAEFGLLFIGLAIYPAYLHWIEKVFYYSLSLHLMLITFFAIQAISFDGLGDVYNLGEKLGGLAAWLAVIFVGSYLSLNTSEVRQLYSWIFFAVVVFAVYLILVIKPPAEYLFSYSFRWLNMITNILVVIVLVVSIGRLRLRQASQDNLTGLMNRYSMYSVIERETALSAITQTPLSILMFDIDHFKSINDTYGHMAGDKILIEFTEVIKLGIRRSDSFGRWGGEEFLVLLPGTDTQEAYLLAERLRASLEKQTFANGLTITASFGVAAYLEGETVEYWIHRADQALYQAKQGGRNRVVVF